VCADPDLLRRALGNLLANALRYAEPGTAISTVAQQGPETTTLHVENRGPTIEPHHLERIFDRFYRADPSRHRSSEPADSGFRSCAASCSCTAERGKRPAATA